MNLPFTDEELLKPAAAVLESVRPKLHLDGGDMSFLGVCDGVVFVRLEGACKGCSHATGTLQNLIHKSLKSMIHPDIGLENVMDESTLPAQIARP